VVPVTAAEPLVSRWRERFDRSAAEGMPPHITVLSPFLPESRLTGAVLARLSELCADVPVLELEFPRLGHFPGVVYLAPEPAGEARRLTMAIAGEWPEAPPYGGAFDEVIPHLTVAQGADDTSVAAIHSELSGRLPLPARLVEACLYVFDGSRWQVRARLPFRERTSTAAG
jgi:hypothetical protein